MQTAADDGEEDAQVELNAEEEEMRARELEEQERKLA